MNGFAVGDRVVKLGGGYQGEWEIRAVFTKSDGTPRVVAESLVLKGLLHVFSPEQFRRKPSPDDEPRREPWRPPTDPGSDPVVRGPGPMA